MALTISKHAQERYAERIMDRDNKTDIAVFIRDHEDKIQQDIEKMVEYGTLLYEGKSSRDPKKTVGVTINGAWVVIWDTVDFVVITLYEIDLGVNEAVNKAFIASALEQIEAAKAEQAKVSEDTQKYISIYKNTIALAEGSLTRYRKIIKDLEAQISGCRQMIASMTVDNDVADEKVREKVEILIGRQRF